MIRSRLAPVLLACLALIAAAAAVLLLIMIAQHGRILPGTTVAGVDVGGQDVASARRILTPILAAESRHPVLVSTPGARFVLDPRDVGLAIDVAGTVEDALARGRTWRFGSLAARARLPVRSADVAPRRTVDEELLRAWVDALADRIDRPDSVGTVDIARAGAAFNVTTVGPHGAVAVDRTASLDALRAVLVSGARTGRIVVAAELPPVGRAPIERVSDDIEVALRGPLILRHERRTLTIPPDVLAELLIIDRTTDSLGRPVPAVMVPVHRVQTLLGADGRATFDRPGRDARILTDREPPATLSALGATTFRPVEATVGVTPSESRVGFVADLAAAQIEQLIGSRRRVAYAAVEERDPDLTTAAALEGLPTHLLGTFTTFYAAGAPRTVNIELLADILDDHLIAPGATFSVNGTSGPRRCEDGFVPAGTIIRGELVDTCGGGVSQIGTTVMNAAFFAGLRLDQWQPHSFFISRYPAGREATLSYPDLDVRFTNDTDAWLVLRASTTPDSVTVSIYGTPRWREVRADHGERLNPTDFGREERTTTALAPGVRRVVQAGGGGFTTSVSRTRTPVDPAAESTRERWTTVYRPQQRIVEVGAPRPVAPSVPDE